MKKVKVKRDASAPKRKKTVKSALSVAHPEPENWRRVYALIQQHREEEVAPVDTMGCDSAGRFESDARSQRLSILFSLILSAQTKDEYTDAAMKNLRAAVGGCITVDALLNTSSKDIQSAVRPAGMAEKKTKYLLETAKLLKEHFDSDVPRTVEGLMSLSGVGPKITFLALQVAWNQNDGIGVDVHVHRLSNVLGWNSPEAADEERTRINLESWLPKEYWKEVNHLLVGFGQTICSKKTPKCGQCRVNAAGLCPSAREESQSRLSKEEVAALEIKLEDSEALYKIEPV
ncbi:DNA glycosylase [Cylindrobasidium torrendii FP15055 ss-10]|uniref:Endonuclease III homolog n=1 Tax=Cylindrobasidium torrendii FP15055 ss-10 TaxID=1314674 RepID=A0A0D7B7Q1_9AGAR|nr:DNA glycosylase [Cylindrobasidium torrendii FP15055 ss-10]